MLLRKNAMSTMQNQQNEIFNKAIENYLPTETESEQLTRPEVIEELLTDEFVAKTGITFEGDE